ncbi:MAG: glycosyltransferase, partial [Methanothrix sp.]|nr:glycosyltransferase [Methanothrix sp.]
MRIVIDLQGAQAENRFRGIGRYSLSFAKAIARNRGEHDVHLALNGLFSETIEPIRASFEGLLPQENIHVWYIPGPVCQREPGNAWRREAAETIREAFLASLQPDMVLIPSLFEGLVDDAVTSIGMYSKIIPTAVTLYDLIPFIYQDPYLENPAIKSWYLKKIDHLRRADILLAISKSTANDAVNYLGFTEDSIANISGGTDSHFSLLETSEDEELSLRKKYGLVRPFILYTSGIDYRKNNERLIRAFALLPKDIRQSHQLAIVCSIQPDSKSMLEKLARQHGLDADEVILTGHVPEEDLVLLYNLCKLFVFPSLYEGFGLPVVEAMRCGAPVIGANTSSLPEVIGRDDALFDPNSEDAIAAKITQVLTDPAFRDDLIRHGTDHAKKFSWDGSAKKAIAAFELFHAKRQQNHNRDILPARRPKLAYVSPLPPAHSGIADYSAELLPELAIYYDIEVITAQPDVSDQWIRACLPIRSVEWFVKNARRYDRVIYHFGNSAYHAHMFELLERFPGLVVLHDFFLSGIQEHREIYSLAPNAWTRALYSSHGYAAVRERFHARDRTGVVFKYPCNFDVLRQAVGVIVHSAYSVRLASKWYGNEMGDDWSVILHLRIPARDIDKREARKDLGLDPDDFIICSFGLLGPAKQNHRLIHAWLSCSLAQDPH